MKQKELEISRNQNKLGQGISALISGDRARKSIINDVDNSEKVVNINLDDIIAGVYQPRTFFDDESLIELSHSIEENGVIQPITLREVKESQKYEIIAGERRFRASKLANKVTIPAIVKKINNHQALELALIENIQRQDLTAIEEAKGYKKLADEFSYSHDLIASKVGKSRSHVANLIRLLLLPESIQELINDGLISMGHARALINVENAEEIVDMILDKSLSVREVEDMVKIYSVKKDVKIKEVKKDEELIELTKIISNLANMDVNIKFNRTKKSGELIFKFETIDKVKDLINKLSYNESE